MVVIKYRVHEVAKDLGVPSKDIIDFLGKYYKEPRKHMTALSDDELNLVFEHYTKDKSVKNFDSYFAANQKPKTETKEKTTENNNTDTKEKEVAAVTAAANDAETKTNDTNPTLKPANKNEDTKPTDKTQTKPETQKPAAANPVGAVKPAAYISGAAEKPAAARPATAGKPFVADKQNVNARPAAPAVGHQFQPRNQGFNQRPAQNQTQRQNGLRPGFEQRPSTGNYQGSNNRFNSRPNQPAGGNRSFDKAPRNNGFRPNLNTNNNTQQPTAPVRNPNAPFKAPAQPQQKGPQTYKQKTGEFRYVDTRGSEVELDKYNDHYEEIAPQQSKRSSNLQNKQKIKQKSANRKPFFAKRESDAEKLRRLQLEKLKQRPLEISIPDELTVGELAARLKVTAAKVIKKLMGLGIMAAISDVIDFDTASLVAIDFGAKVEKEIEITIEDQLIDDSEDMDENLLPRDPVVCVMGHVDHGKTSLLDAIRNTNVAAGEAGGITQNIGASRVKIKGRNITFLDTPGHEAFTAMRARGAMITDIAILVVAADDGIMPQTIEAINHAKAANISIIVAINKMDKPGANPDHVMQQLTEHGLVPEEWGGETICVPVSAVKKEGIDKLLETVLLVAEMNELKANPNRAAKGAVIEARLDKGRGPIATMLIQNGTLHTGDVIIAGTSVGHVRVMNDYKGREITEAGPSIPVEITGLSDVPEAGDIFHVVKDERMARELVDQRFHEQKEEQFNTYKKVTLDNLFSQMEEGEIKELDIIVKADVQGSVEAVTQSLEKLSNSEVHVKVIHGGVGAISDNDVKLAEASNAIIIGFNVRPDVDAKRSADISGVDMRMYRVIYDCIEEIGSAMKGMLDPKFREVQLGRVEARQIYKISNIGTISGSYVLEGKITRNSQIRVVRDGIVITEDKIASLKRFKDDAKEVVKGYECGVGLEKFNDIKVGDIFEAFVIEEYREE